jgi:hypothetical protein
LDRKPSKVSKNVKIMSEYNRTDMADENQRKIQPGSIIILKGCFSIFPFSFPIDEAFVRLKYY